MSSSSSLPAGLSPSQPAVPGGDSGRTPVGGGRQSAAPPPPGGGGEREGETEIGTGVKGVQAAVEAADRQGQGAGWKKTRSGVVPGAAGRGEASMPLARCRAGRERSAAPRGRLPSPPHPRSAPRRPTQHHADHVQRHEGQPPPVKHAGSAGRPASGAAAATPPPPLAAL